MVDTSFSLISSYPRAAASGGAAGAVAEEIIFLSVGPPVHASRTQIRSERSMSPTARDELELGPLPSCILPQQLPTTKWIDHLPPPQRNNPYGPWGARTTTGGGWACAGRHCIRSAAERQGQEQPRERLRVAGAARGGLGDRRAKGVGLTTLARCMFVCLPVRRADSHS